MHGFHRALGDRSGIALCGPPRRSLRPARFAQRTGSALRHLGVRERFGLEPVCTRRLPDHWWAGSSVIGPMYIAEISPALKRGRLVGMFQVNVVVGILLAYLSNYLVSQTGFGPAEWRWKLGVVAIPAAAFFVALFGIPQSPRWLVVVGRPEEAREVLQRVGEPNPNQELQEIAETLLGCIPKQRV